MTTDRINRLWGISLIVIALVTLIIVGSGMIGLELPAAAKIICGFIDLIALVVLVYTSVRRRRGV